MNEQLQVMVSERLPAFFGAGGPVVLLLMAMSVVAVTIAIVKLLQFRGARIGDAVTLERAVARYREGRINDAVSSAAASPNPACQAFARALRGRRRGLPEATVRDEALRWGERRLQELRQGLRALEVIASLAPLLGLLGTVLGMIEAFRQLELAGSQVDPGVLSGGIWEALLTTAVGLAVAIPAVIVLNWLESRVERVAQDADDAVTRAFTEDLSAEVDSEADREPRAALRSAAVAR